MYVLKSPQRGDSNKYTKRMIHKKLFKSIRYSCFRQVHIKVLYSSKFDLTAKSLVTNTVVITRVLCILGIGRGNIQSVGQGDFIKCPGQLHCFQSDLGYISKFNTVELQWLEH